MVVEVIFTEKTVNYTGYTPSSVSRFEMKYKVLFLVFATDCQKTSARANRFYIKSIRTRIASVASRNKNHYYCPGTCCAYLYLPVYIVHRHNFNDSK